MYQQRLLHLPHRHDLMPTIYETTNHPLFTGPQPYLHLGSKVYVGYMDTDPVSMAAYKDFEKSLKCPSGGPGDWVANGVLAMHPGDALVLRDPKTSNDPLDDVLAVIVTGQLHHSASQIQAYEAATQNVLGLQHERTPEVTAFEATRCARMIRGMRAFSVALAVQQSRRVVAPTASLDQKRRNIDAYQTMVHDLVMSTADMLGNVQATFPASYQAAFEANMELTGQPSVGRARVLGTSSIQVNISAAGLSASDNRLESQLGDFGSEHFDRNDSPDHFTTMFSNPDVPATYNPGAFHILQLGIFVTLDKYVGVTFSGRRKHVGTAPTPPPNAPPAPYAYRKNTVWYPKRATVDGKSRFTLASLPGRPLPVDGDNSGKGKGAKGKEVKGKEVKGKEVKGKEVKVKGKGKGGEGKGGEGKGGEGKGGEGKGTKKKPSPPPNPEPLYLTSEMINMDDVGFVPHTTNRATFARSGHVIMDRESHMNFMGRSLYLLNSYVLRQLPTSYGISVDVQKMLSAITYNGQGTDAGKRIPLLGWAGAPNINGASEDRQKMQLVWSGFQKKVRRFVPSIPTESSEEVEEVEVDDDSDEWDMDMMEDGWDEMEDDWDVDVDAMVGEENVMEGSGNELEEDEGMIEGDHNGKPKRVSKESEVEEGSSTCRSGLRSYNAQQPSSSPKLPTKKGPRMVFSHVEIPIASVHRHRSGEGTHKRTSNFDPSPSSKRLRRSPGTIETPLSPEVPVATSLKHRYQVDTPPPALPSSTISLQGFSVTSTEVLDSPPCASSSKHLRTSMSPSVNSTKRARVESVDMGGQDGPAEISAGAKYPFVERLTTAVLWGELTSLQHDLTAAGDHLTSGLSFSLPQLLRAYKDVAKDPISARSPLHIRNLITQVQNYGNDQAVAAVYTRFERYSVILSTIHMWYWLDIIVKQHIREIVEQPSRPSEARWLQAAVNIADRAFTWNHNQDGIVFDPAKEPDLRALLSVPVVILRGKKRRYLKTVPSDLPLLLDAITHTVLDLLITSLEFPQADGAKERKRAWVMGIIADTIGPDFLATGYAWDAYNSFTIKEFFPIASAYSSLNSDLVQPFKAALRAHPIARFDSNEHWLFTRFSETLQLSSQGTLSPVVADDIILPGLPSSTSRFPGLDRFLKQCLQYLRGSLLPQDPISSYLHRDPDFRLPFREKAPSRLRFRTKDGPFCPSTIRTNAGLYSAIIYRGITYGSPFSRHPQSPMVFTDFQDWEKRVASFQRSHPLPTVFADETRLYFCKRNAYGQSIINRGVENAEDFWLKVVQLDWVSEVDRGMTFRDCLSLISKADFRSMGSLCNYLLACDLHYAGACAAPTLSDVAGAILRIRGGAFAALITLGLVPAGTKPSVRQIEAVLEGLQAHITATFSQEERDEMGWDLICLEHLLCKFSRALNQRLVD